jgi:hypothetical protein
MSKFNDPGDPGAPTQGGGSGRSVRSRRRAAAVVWSAVVAGGVLLSTQALDSPEAHALTREAMAGAAVPAASTPPPGSTWIEGVITDQCGQGQDNVNVEAWSDDTAGAPTASARTPAASALTYGGPAASALTYGGALQGHGFFRLEVPSDRPYRIDFSAVGGQEDGDPFQMMRYGSDRPIMVRTAKTAALPAGAAAGSAIAGSAGRVRDLGTIPLTRHDQPPATSTTTASARSKIPVGKRGKVRATISGSCTSDVTGKVVVKVAGHKITRRLTTADHGSRTIRLPKLPHLGKYSVRVHFTGTSTVQGSKAKPVKVKVVRK